MGCSCFSAGSEGNRSAAVVHPCQHSAAHGALQYGKEEGQRFHVIMYCPALSPSAGSAKSHELRVRMGSRYSASNTSRPAKRRCIFGVWGGSPTR